MDINIAKAGVVLSVCCFFINVTSARATGPATPNEWYAAGQQAIQEVRELTNTANRAKNVILFVGDGMGIATVTATRIFEGQLRGDSGEENTLSFEHFPYVALSKTYSV